LRRAADLPALAGAGPDTALTTLAVEHYSPQGGDRDILASARGGLFTTCRPQESAVPKSQVRKKKVYTPPTDVRPTSTAASRKPSPIWLPISAVTLIVFGIGWLVTYYLSAQEFPVAAWGYWNLAVGFGCMVTSLGILSRWR
jgi:hypothetical protein